MERERERERERKRERGRRRGREREREREGERERERERCWGGRGGVVCFVRVHLFRNTSQACSRRSTNYACARLYMQTGKRIHASSRGSGPEMA